MSIRYDTHSLPVCSGPHLQWHKGRNENQYLTMRKMWPTTEFACKGQLPVQDIVTKLRIVFIKLIKLKAQKKSSGEGVLICFGDRKHACCSRR